MDDAVEPSVWLFDGTEPQRDLPADEAEQIAAMTLTFDEPIFSPLPDSAVEGVRELFRGFYAHTPYRRIARVEQVDEQTIAVIGEKRSSASDPDGWEPHIHDRDVEAMQSALIEYFGPLWRVRRQPADSDRPADSRGVLEIGRVVGRRFHYPGTKGNRQ